MRSLELAVKYLSGLRLTGTNAERTALTTYSGQTDSIGTWGDLISNESGTLTNPTDAPAGLASAGNTKCWNSTALQIKSRTGMAGNTARTFIPSGTDWTFAFWYNSNDWAVGGSNSPAIFNAKNSGGTTRMWFEFASGPNAPSGNEPQFNVQYYGNGSPSSNGLQNYTGTLATGNWHWMCIDYDTSAGTITWRVDNATSGTGYATETQAGITSIDISTIDYWLIGADAEAYDGKLTDMCIWNTILTSGQRNSIFGNGGSTATLATTQSNSNITWYHDCQSITFPITNKAVATPTYPKLQDGTIYEEQDTGKIYIWNLSTNTWSEIT